MITKLKVRTPNLLKGDRISMVRGTIVVDRVEKIQGTMNQYVVVTDEGRSIGASRSMIFVVERGEL